MFIAHMPSGYLLAKYLHKKCNNIPWKVLLMAGLIGSIVPDLDLFYFYLVDARQHAHHTYPSHIPFYWAVACFLIVGVSAATKHNNLLPIVSIFFLGVFIHLVLDTIAGGILWFYPINDQYVTFAVVDAQYSWWVLNFIFHWTFLLEIVVMLSAAIVYVRARKEAVRQPEKSDAT